MRKNRFNMKKMRTNSPFFIFVAIMLFTGILFGIFMGNMAIKSEEIYSNILISTWDNINTSFFYNLAINLAYVLIIFIFMSTPFNMLINSSMLILKGFLLSYSTFLIIKVNGITSSYFIIVSMISTFFSLSAIILMCIIALEFSFSKGRAKYFFKEYKEELWTVVLLCIISSVFDILIKPLLI